MRVSIIAALGRNREIGKDNDLMWHLPDDMRFFRETTVPHHVIMGRRNYESIPPKYRPFSDRVNIVISRDPSYPAPDCIVCTDLQQALDTARDQFEDEAFIIGGAQIYQLALDQGLVDRMYLTHIDADFPDADTHFPVFRSEEWDLHTLFTHSPDERHAYGFRVVQYDRKLH